MLDLRTSVGKSQQVVSDDTGISAGALHRIENAKTTPQAGTLNHLLDYYGVADPDRRSAMHELRRRSRQLKWLELFEGGSLPDSYRSLTSFEADATRMSVYESLFVFGLLQTPGYAATVIRAMAPELSDDEVQTRLDIRMRRQESLTSPRAPQLWVILDEAVIRRQVGDVSVYRDQLIHLAEVSRRPNIELQIIPFDAGAHQGMPGSFHLLEFLEPDPPLIYMENAGGGLFVETDSEVAWYRTSFQRLTAQALSPHDTTQLIERAAEVAT